MSEQEESLPDLHILSKEVSLYKKFESNINDEFDHESEGVIEQTTSMDCYCIECGDNSVFHKWDYTRVCLYDSKDKYHYSDEKNVYVAKYRCARKLSHHLYFIYYKNNNQITKIGQYPSMADFATGEISKYKKVLDQELLAEFKRAIGLNAHGVGVGSYVYLRRIFERLVKEAYEKAAKNSDWDGSDYSKLRMDEKVTHLKGYLPDFLVDNKILHSILSKGIHELTEEECLEHFTAMKLGIEVILDEKIYEKERTDKIKLATKSIQKAHGKITQSESSTDT